MKHKKTVCFSIKSSWHAIARLYNEQAVKHSLSASMGYVLLNLDQELGTPATKIGPLIGTESRSLTRMLKSLEDDGLIYKVQDTKDKRLVKIFLTTKGIKKKEIAKQVVKTFNKAVRELIPEEKLSIFFEVIEKINQVAETKNIYKPDNTFKI
jgi:DNA-binding MarR family transcriptional regulator